MNDQSQETGSTDAGGQPEFLDRFEERRARRAERRAARGSGSGAWIGGTILIALGLIILLQNLDLFAFDNWWALFILIPAIGAFGAAWRNYVAAGRRLTGPARGSLLGGLVMTLVAAVFLFGLNWGILGPVLVILVGAGILLNTLLP
jgi:hypothetical protein